MLKGVYILLITVCVLVSAHGKVVIDVLNDETNVFENIFESDIVILNIPHGLGDGTGFVFKNCSANFQFTFPTALNQNEVNLSSFNISSSSIKITMFPEVREMYFNIFNNVFIVKSTIEMGISFHAIQNTIHINSCAVDSLNIEGELITFTDVSIRKGLSVTGSIILFNDIFVENIHSSIFFNAMSSIMLRNVTGDDISMDVSAYEIGKRSSKIELSILKSQFNKLSISMDGTGAATKIQNTNCNEFKYTGEYHRLDQELYLFNGDFNSVILHSLQFRMFVLDSMSSNLHSLMMSDVLIDEFHMSNTTYYDTFIFWVWERAKVISAYVDNVIIYGYAFNIDCDVLFPGFDSLHLTNGYMERIDKPSYHFLAMAEPTLLYLNNVTFADGNLPFTVYENMNNTILRNITVDRSINVRYMNSVSFIDVSAETLEDFSSTALLLFKQSVHYENLYIINLKSLNYALFNVGLLENDSAVLLSNITIHSSSIWSIYLSSNLNMGVRNFTINGLRISNSQITEVAFVIPDLISSYFSFNTIYFERLIAGGGFQFIGNLHNSNNSVTFNDVQVISSTLPFFVQTFSVRNFFMTKSYLELDDFSTVFVINNHESSYLNVTESEFYIPSNSFFVIHLSQGSMLYFKANNLVFDTNDAFVNEAVELYKSFLIYGHYIELSMNMVYTKDMSRVVWMQSQDRTKDFFLFPIGINSIDTQDLALLLGANVFHHGFRNFLLINTQPFFSFSIEKFSDITKLPFEADDIKGIRIYIYELRESHLLIMNESPGSFSCTKGFGWDFDKKRCQSCTAGYRQVIGDAGYPLCELDDNHRDLTYLERDAITSSMYKIPAGNYVYEYNGTTTLIDCMNAFCVGGQVYPGMSGKSYETLDYRETQLFLSNNKTLDNNGCAIGHHGKACTECYSVAKYDNEQIIGFNQLSHQCGLVKYRFVRISTLVFAVHCLMMFVVAKKYYLLNRIPWSKLLDSSSRMTDFEAFELLSNIKNFILVLWPLVISETNGTALFIEKSAGSFFVSALFSPFANFAILVRNELPYIHVIYVCVIFLLFFPRISYWFFCSCYACWLSFLSLWYFGIPGIAVTVTVILLSLKSRILKKILFALSALSLVLGSVHEYKFKDYENVFTSLVLYALPALILLFTTERKIQISISSLLSLNLLFLPYITKLAFLRTLPVYTEDKYGKLEGYWHTLSAFETHYNWYLIVILFIHLCFYVFCFVQTKKEVGYSLHDFRMIFFYCLVARAIYTLFSYIAHSQLPNQVFLLALLTYIVFAKPFNIINSLMLKILICLVLLSFFYDIFNTFSSTLIAFCVVIPTSMVVLVAQRREKGEEILNPLNEYLEELSTV
ncbi:hypothetical protein PCE1_002812 [Barthelona sp. PCE]